MSASASILWFRLDLRLADHPALQSAILRDAAVIPVFIHAPEEEAPWEPGGASRWWLHRSLASLDASLRALGSQLIIRRGPSLDTLRALARETRAGAVYWNRRYEPALIARDTRIKDALLKEGLIVGSFNAALLHEPWTIRNRNAAPFQVFTPFWKHCLAMPAPRHPLNAPQEIPAPDSWPKSLKLASLQLQPKIPWDQGLQAAWQPGEPAARTRLAQFLKASLSNYQEARDRPGAAGTSRLSPHLHFGEISPFQVWHALRSHAETAKLQGPPWTQSRFLTEIGWREFSHHLLYHFPHTPARPLRSGFENFPWRANQALFDAWRRGRTGFPIVDAGMRELRATGWMHNRVRMIAASFLVKDLLISWRDGAAWFWDELVDADLAQNTLGWQWSAGCGADAAPYFRIFNPAKQGDTFDPQGAYVRRWCPELANLPDIWLQKPSLAPPEILAAAGVQLGETYPSPVVSHAAARDSALRAFQSIKQ